MFLISCLGAKGDAAPAPFSCLSILRRMFKRKIHAALPAHSRSCAKGMMLVAFMPQSTVISASANPLKQSYISILLMGGSGSLTAAILEPPQTIPMALSGL